MAGAGQIPENFGWLVDIDPQIHTAFYLSYEQEASIKDMFYAVETSEKAKETDQLVGSFGRSTQFQGKVNFQTVDPDYQVVYEHTEYSDGFIVERSMADDKQYPVFNSATDLAQTYAYSKEEDAASLFNGGFSGTTGYDGKTLFATDHPRSQTDSTAVSNRLALDLNSDNLQTAVDTLEGIKDDKGKEIQNMADLLIVPRALRKTAQELGLSQLVPDSANNAINVHQGMQYVMWPWLTDPKAWFVLSTRSSKGRGWLKWFDRVMAEFKSGFFNETQLYKYWAYQRYSYGYSNFRFAVGSTGAP